MRKRNGMHFYINIQNFNEIVKKDEEANGTPTHVIHAMDTFFSMIEIVGKKYHPDTFIVEKITGSRLHLLVVNDDIAEAFCVVSDVGCFAFKLASCINRKIGKYSNLMDFRIQVGACYGKFYDFVFEETDEETSIGYSANMAAKIQSKTQAENIGVSTDVFEAMVAADKKRFSVTYDLSLLKYGQDRFYTARLGDLYSSIDYGEDIEYAVVYANALYLKDIEFSSAMKPISFDYLSKAKCKILDGVPLFADVRDFTSQFNDDDSNIDEMSKKTKEILTSMFSAVKKAGGIHIQFQGDREFALFHNYGEYECYKDAVIAGLRIVDIVEKNTVSVGIGAACGSMYASKIGAREEKDNILIGKVVSEADELEDGKAEKHQIVISADVYRNLAKIDSILSGLFQKKDSESFFTNSGYKDYLDKIRINQLRVDTDTNRYNGAWRL